MEDGFSRNAAGEDLRWRHCTETNLLKNGEKGNLNMNKENVWKVIKCGGKIVFLTVTVTGKILKELILETTKTGRE